MSIISTLLGGEYQGKSVGGMYPTEDYRASGAVDNKVSGVVKEILAPR